MNFRYPIDAVVFTQGFGDNPDYYKQFGQLGHNGYDIGVVSGTPVYASESGVIYFEGNGVNNGWMGSIAGNCIIIDHGSVYTGYAHLTDTIINIGQKVTQGQLIGHSGATGNTMGTTPQPHLHFEFIAKPVNINNGYYGRVNPSKYLSGSTAGDDMVTDKAQLTRLYDGVLRRPRVGSEGEDVYLGKDSGWVFDDLYKSKERADRLVTTAAILADLNLKLNNANKEIIRLKALPTSTGGDTPLAKDTNAKITLVQTLLNKIYK